MAKNFDGWNDYKKKLDTHTRVAHFDNGEIWWCSVGINVGSEQDSYSADFARPIVILKKFTDRIFLGVPLTTKIKVNMEGIVIEFNGTKIRYFCGTYDHLIQKD